MVINTDTLIVGAGFCGRAVATELKKDYLVIDGGEPVDNSKIPSSYTNDIPPIQSKTKPTTHMGLMDANWQSYVMGGNSNWWGGWASRISKNTFNIDGVLKWDRDYEDVVPYYEKAEKLLNTHGDTKINPSLVGEIPGSSFWREWASSLFENAYITSETKNFTKDNIGLCLGRGTCRACPENAKTIPSHIKIENIGHSTYLKEIIMDDNVAKSAIVSDSDGDFEIYFNKIVIAAGGFENVKIIKQFNPTSGMYFQDHTSGELLVKLNKKVPYRKIGAESHLVIDDILVNHNGIEIKSIMLTAEPASELLSMSNVEVNDENRETFATIWMQIEIPPEWNLEMKNKDSQFYVDYTTYIENLYKIDEAVDCVKEKLKLIGIDVVAQNLKYKSHFGGFHLSGTTAIGKVVDSDCKVIGTKNVYVAGASVIPRSGGSGPSLTAVALSIKLGEHLNNI